MIESSIFQNVTELNVQFNNKFTKFKSNIWLDEFHLSCQPSLTLKFWYLKIFHLIELWVFYLNVKFNNKFTKFKSIFDLSK